MHHRFNGTAEKTRTTPRLPLMLTVLATVFLGERAGVWRWGALLIGFAGVVAVSTLRPDEFSSHLSTARFSLRLPFGLSCEVLVEGNSTRIFA